MRGNLLVVLIAQATNLVDLDTTLHQLGYNLTLTGTSLCLSSNELHDLLIAHALSNCHLNRQQHHKKQNVFFHIHKKYQLSTKLFFRTDTYNRLVVSTLQ